MNLIATYLEKDPENAEIEPPTFKAQTSRLERFTPRWFTALSEDKGKAISTMSLVKKTID